MYNGMELSSGRGVDRAKIRIGRRLRASASDAQVSPCTT
jgi:hypothetical protein